MLSAGSFPNLEAQLRVAGKLRPGRCFWVGNAPAYLMPDGQAAVDAESAGDSYLQPLATLDFATSMAKVVGSRQDNIVCLPGHAEDIVAATTFVPDVAGINYLGLGTGTLRPTLHFKTLAAASVACTGANIRFANFVFSNVNQDELLCMVSAAGVCCEFENCTFILSLAGVTNKDSILGLSLLAGSSGSKVRNCTFLSPAAAATGGCEAIRIAGVDSVEVDGNYILGCFTVNVGTIYNTAAATNLKIVNNEILNLTSNNTTSISCYTGSKGLVDGNSMLIGTGTTPLVGDAMAWGVNHYAAAVATHMTAL
jgi:hypothetical protein